MFVTEAQRFSVKKCHVGVDIAVASIGIGRGVCKVFACTVQLHIILNYKQKETEMSTTCLNLMPFANKERGSIVSFTPC